MASTRRVSKSRTETRSLLLDAAEHLMSELGYAAVTSRLLGKTAGLSPQIVYYYFDTMDDLFEAVLSRTLDYYLEAIETIHGSQDPIVALWKLSADPSRSIVITELMALANHRKGLKKMIHEFSEKFSANQTEIVAREFTARNIDTDRFPPAIIASLIENMARGFAFADTLGLDSSDEVRRYVAAQLGALSRTVTATDDASTRLA